MREYPDITILVTSLVSPVVVHNFSREEKAIGPVLRLFMFMGSVTCNQCSLWHEG